MNKIIYTAAAALALCLAMNVYAAKTSESLRENVTRLHIIADSDSEADQEVKIKVRDAILADVRENGAHADAERYGDIAEKTLAENGFSYGARAETGIFHFPRKSYKDMTFPAGSYFGMRVVLGSGGGQNWWCVMNPPLCFTEDADGEISESGRAELKAALDGEAYEIITQKPRVRFKIVEIFNSLSEHL